MGYEPTAMEQRLKMLFLLRLIPFERNYNLVELGPRGTGKSFAVQELFLTQHCSPGQQPLPIFLAT